MSCYTRNRNIDASRARERHHNNKNVVFREHRAGSLSIFQDHHYDLLAEDPPSQNPRYVNPPPHNPEFVPDCEEWFAGRSSAMGSSTLPTDIPSKEAVFGHPSNQGTVSPTSTLSFRDETVPFEAVPLAKAVVISSAEESKDTAIPFVAAHRIDDHVNGPPIPHVTNYKEDPTQRYHAIHRPPQQSFFPDESSIDFNNPFAAERPSWLDLENETDRTEPTTKRGNKSQSKRWSRKFAAGTAKRSLKKKVGKESQNCLWSLERSSSIISSTRGLGSCCEINEAAWKDRRIGLIFWLLIATD